ncbi:uncharacterized protein LOC108734398 isoform X2 [Agrilus planipennis]|uniref:Uncharacterized protein LOC108734398 isoform X2 n=1 Tax=Agrilus planipennis TaxID=224129 RepID=A0A7F5R6N0_AGRPL|nr:uncharacterized protein LOC108734398 isoform X2 [Agrilus planipennis]
MTINSQSGPRSTRPSEDLITTATSALRRLHFKTGRGITKTNAKTQAQTPVPKVVLMGSSTASETTINTSTDSSNTMITTMTATDGETTDCHDSLEINDSFDILNLDNNQLEGGNAERGAHCIIPVTMSPKTPTTVKHERQFTFDVMNVTATTPQTACCKKNDTFVFDTLLQNDEICMQEEKSVEKLMEEHKHEVKQPSEYKPVKNDAEMFRPLEDVNSRTISNSKDMLRGSSSEESKSSTTTKAESDGGRSSSSSRTQSTIRVKPRRSMSVDKTGHDYRLEVKSTVSLDRGGNQTGTPRTKHRHKKRHHSSSAKNKVDRFTYDEKHISKYREQARMTPPLPDLRIDFFNESAETTGSNLRDSLLIPISHEKRGSVCLNKCIRDVGAQLESSSTINVTTNPLENSVRFGTTTGANSRGTRQPQATIVVQQPSVSLDHSGVSTILLKNGSDFVSNVETTSKVKEENVKQLLDVSNNLTMEEIHDFEMRYGSPHHSRSQSVKTPGRSSGRPNYLCLPQQRSRVASMPNTGVEEEYYRLRHFSITGKGIVNRGDSLKSRRSRSNNSVASSNSSTEQLPTAVSATGSCRTSASCSLASSRESSTSAPGPTPYKVLMLGGPAVGKSSLVSQFMTSEYLHAYDTSIDDESGEKSVSVLLAGEESELIFIDFATADLSPESCINKYQDPHAYCVVYSSADRSSLVCAERILQTLWMMDNISTKAVILVANKADLVRSRVVSTEGKSVATNFECKYIETSVGINHNVDELLVGILTQIRLKLENPERTRDIFRKRSSSRKNFSRNKSPVSGSSTPTGSAQNSPKKYRGSRTSASLKVRSLLGRVWARDSKSKSCENLHVL